MIQMEKRTYELKGFTPIMGSSPANPAVRTQYIASKAPDPVRAGDEEAGYTPDMEDKGLTVFLRDPSSGALMLLDYQVRGFIKSALSSLKALNGIKQARAKVDKYLFASPRRIPILKDGQPVTEEDEVIERPLRAMTMQGERVTLVGSEAIYDPWTIRVTLTLLPNEASKASAKLTWEDVERALDYGELSGLGQFHNGGYGRFTWERVD